MGALFVITILCAGGFSWIAWRLWEWDRPQRERDRELLGGTSEFAAFRESLSVMPRRAGEPRR
ncbi:MAG TPA: hypothetical protein VM345_01790 [Acidimicrobiales bacterium]|nr:hypothetical protein [Acidimicrobiales bacterium]